MSEGRLISTLFDLGLTTLNDYANEAKFLQELQKNGTDLNKLMQNETAANATANEYNRRYHRRYGYGDDGYYRGGGGFMPIPIPIPIGGFGGFGRSGYGGFGGGSYKTAMMMAAMPAVANHITGKKGFGKSFGYGGYGNHGYGMNHGGGFGGGHGYGGGFGGGHGGYGNNYGGTYGGNYGSGSYGHGG